MAHELLVGPKPAAMSGPDPIRTRLGGAVDVFVFHVLKQVFTRSHRGNLALADYRALEAGWMELSSEAVEDNQLETWFPRPDPPLVSAVRVASLPGGWLEDLRFSGSGYAIGRPTAYEMLRRYPDNAVAHARHFRHADSGHPAVVWAHGWGMGHYPVETAVSRARWLYDLGLDVYLYTQPFHGARQPPRVLFAGSLHPSTHITRTNEAFLQTAWEIRALLAWHRRISDAPGGVIGLSLGGYVAALLASVAPELAFAICLLPMVDVPALMWSNGEGTPDRARAEREGVVFDNFCQSMAVHAPLARCPKIPRERLMLIGALGDRIIPPVHTRVLWEHWGRPRLHWYSDGHLTHFGRRGYLDQIARFLAEIDVMSDLGRSTPTRSRSSR